MEIVFAMANQKPDGRSSKARKLRALTRSLADEMGGETSLGPAERALLKAGALAILRVEELQTAVLTDAAIDDEVVCRLINATTRVLATIVGKKRKRDASAPDLRAYLKSKAAAS